MNIFRYVERFANGRGRVLFAGGDVRAHDRASYDEGVCRLPVYLNDRIRFQVKDGWTRVERASRYAVDGSTSHGEDCARSKALVRKRFAGSYIRVASLVRGEIGPSASVARNGI